MAFEVEHLSHERVAHFRTIDGAVVAVYRMRRGEGCMLHEHPYPHDAFVVEGAVTFSIGDAIVKRIEAPETLRFPEGAMHGFRAETDAALVVTTHAAEYARRYLDGLVE